MIQSYSFSITKIQTCLLTAVDRENMSWTLHMPVEGKGVDCFLPSLSGLTDGKDRRNIQHLEVNSFPERKTGMNGKQDQPLFQFESECVEPLLCGEIGNKKEWLTLMECGVLDNKHTADILERQNPEREGDRA